MTDISDFAMDYFSLEGKNAIVTGGNTGLGQAFTLALAAAGANVFVPSIVDDDGTTGALVEERGRPLRVHEGRRHRRRARRPRSSPPASTGSARSTSSSTAPASARWPACSTSAASSGTPPWP